MITEHCRYCPTEFRSADPSAVGRLRERHEAGHRGEVIMRVSTQSEQGGAKVGPLAIFASFVGLFLWGWTHSSRTPNGAWLLAVIVAAIGIRVIVAEVRHARAKHDWLREQDIKRVRESIPAPPPEPCIEHASCEPNDHTYSWPCAWAPGTGHRWLEFREGIRQ